MTSSKQKITKPVAGKMFSAYGGIDIYDIIWQYGEQYVIWRWNFGKDKERIHKSKAYMNARDGRAYFIVNGRREFLDEYMRYN